jgi:probable HAF family extracellular repeat protein
MQRFTSLWPLVVALAGPLFAQDYTFIKLPPYAQPVAVNSSGEVTGETAQTGHELAFVWTRTGGLQSLGDLGGGASHASAINDSGDVVGGSSLANGTPHAFRWTPAGGMQDLGSPLGGWSEATAINSAGEVAGFSVTPDGSTGHAFFWSPSTGAVDIGPTNGHTRIDERALNNSGEIAGDEYGSVGFAAFRWTQAAGIQQLVDFGYGDVSAEAINGSGQIAGWAAQPNNHQEHATLWAPDGSIQDLGTLSGDTSSSAFFINGAGHVTGYSKPTNCCGAPRTFFWTAAGIVDIGLLPNHPNAHSIPAGLNNRDQIVGMAGATYLWSPTIGLRQISGISLTRSVSHAFNDAGQMVGQGGSSAVLASPTMHVSLSSSQNPSHGGQSVTFTANVSAIIGLPPDGEQVSFLNGKTVLGTATLSNGTASLTTSALAVGTHSITAKYAGDNNYLPNKSAALTQVVNP